MCDVSYINKWKDGSVDDWVDCGWLDGWMYGWMDGGMDGQIGAWMDGWMNCRVDR